MVSRYSKSAAPALLDAVPTPPASPDSQHPDPDVKPASPDSHPLPEPGTPGAKRIPPARDRRQSIALSILLGTVVLAATAARELSLLTAGRATLAPLLLSAAFALAAFALRSATAPAAAAGAVLCLALTAGDTAASRLPASAGLAALVTLFLLTVAATRFGRAAKQKRGLAEPRHGRRLSQILANLGLAALLAATGHLLPALAALAEASADTVSSEIGQAIAGPTFLLTTRRRVPPGTDGALSLPGTLAGLAAVLLLASLAAATLPAPAALLPLLAAATLGLLADSLLGATLERRGLLGNDLVNFFSTAVAALAAALLFRAHPLH